MSKSPDADSLISLASAFAEFIGSLTNRCLWLCEGCGIDNLRLLEKTVSSDAWMPSFGFSMPFHPLQTNFLGMTHDSWH